MKPWRCCTVVPSTSTDVCIAQVQAVPIKPGEFSTQYSTTVNANVTFNADPLSLFFFFSFIHVCRRMQEHSSWKREEREQKGKKKRMKGVRKRERERGESGQ